MLKLAAITTALLITAGVLAQSSDYVDELVKTCADGTVVSVSQACALVCGSSDTCREWAMARCAETDKKWRKRQFSFRYEDPDNFSYACSDPSKSNNFVDELIVTGERLSPNELSIVEFDKITGVKLRAAKEFKHKNYEVAFPSLLKMAKMGFVDAQARVGFIYLHGLGGQPKSNLKALGWLGVAVSGTTRATYREYFNRLMREVPDEVLPTVEQTIASYTSDYNHKAKEIVCFRGGDNNHFSCLYTKHMQKRADNLFDACSARDPLCPIPQFL